MKLLHLNVYFKLPDDFEGNLDNAIAEIIKYRKVMKEKNEGAITPPDSEANQKIPMTCTMEDYMQALFEDFIRGVDRGRKLVGEIALMDHDPKTGKVKDIPLGQWDEPQKIMPNK